MVKRYKKGDTVFILETDATHGKSISGGKGYIEAVRDDHYSVIYYGFGGPAGPYRLTDEDLGDWVEVKP